MGPRRSRHFCLVFRAGQSVDGGENQDRLALPVPVRAGHPGTRARPGPHPRKESRCGRLVRRRPLHQLRRGPATGAGPDRRGERQIADPAPAAHRGGGTAPARRRLRLSHPLDPPGHRTGRPAPRPVPDAPGRHRAALRPQLAPDRGRQLLSAAPPLRRPHDDRHPALVTRPGRPLRGPRTDHRGAAHPPRPRRPRPPLRRPVRRPAVDPRGRPRRRARRGPGGPRPRPGGGGRGRHRAAAARTHPGQRAVPRGRPLLLQRRQLLLVALARRPDRRAQCDLVLHRRTGRLPGPHRPRPAFRMGAAGPRRPDAAARRRDVPPPARAGRAHPLAAPRARRLHGRTVVGDRRTTAGGHRATGGVSDPGPGPRGVPEPRGGRARERGRAVDARHADHP
ncbi:hypothetical protein SGPA1_21442 [Streptomyces misionensis JCM 4497]